MTTKEYIVTTERTQTLKNKTIDVDNNTVTNIEGDNFKQQTVADAGKVWQVKSDGFWELGKIQQYKKVSTFTGEVGDVKTMYYLDTGYGTYATGLYVYDSGSSTFVPASISGNVVADNVTIGLNGSGAITVKDNGLTVAKFNTAALSTAVPSTGAVDTKVTTEKAVWDKIKVAAHTLEFTMNTTTFVLTALLKDAEGNTLSTQTVDLPLEQMIVNVSYDNVNEEFVFTLKDGTTIKVPASGILKGVVTQTATQTLTNKTVNADDNTITNLEYDNLKAQTAADEGKTFLVKSDGTWEVNYMKLYHQVSTLPATGNTKFIYYLDTADATHKVGLYVYTGGAYVAVARSGVPFAASSTSENFALGEDANGYYIEE